MGSLKFLTLLLTLISLALAHGDHAREQIPIAADADWATQHMAGNQTSNGLPR